MPGSLKALRLCITFFLCCSAGVSCFAQPQHDTLSQYYSFVYQAGQAITQADYQQAAKSYDRAFSMSCTHFAIDIYNAAVCEAINQNYDRLQVLSKMLILKGADSSFFHKAVFRAFTDSHQWTAILGSYPALVQQRNRSIDTSLIRHIKDLIRRDQAIHCMLPQNAADVEFIRKMNRLNDSLSESLYDLFVQYDYLGEDILGANFNDTVLNPAPLYRALVVHEFQKNGTYLTKALDSAIRRGKLYAELGLGWLELGHSGRIRFLGDYFVYKDTLRSSWTFTDTNSGIYRLNEKALTRLLSETPTPRVLALRRYYYMDEPESIHRRMIYRFRQYTNDKEMPPFRSALPLGVIGNFKEKESEYRVLKDSRIVGVP